MLPRTCSSTRVSFQSLMKMFMFVFEKSVKLDTSLRRLFALLCCCCWCNDPWWTNYLISDHTSVRQFSISIARSVIKMNSNSIKNISNDLYGTAYQFLQIARFSHILVPCCGTAQIRLSRFLKAKSMIYHRIWAFLHRFQH
jgi:hypothetical protein